MKAFLFKVTLISGIVFTCSGIGRNVNDAMLDACLYLSQTDYPEDDIADVELVKA